MQCSILFISHAGEGVGLGHLTRSLVAARSLFLRLGAQVGLVAVGQKIDHRFARNFQIDFSVATGSIDIVVDHFTKDNQYSVICLDLFNPFLVKGLGLVLENIRKTGCRVVAIDSLLGFERLVDLLYVPSYLPPKSFNGSGFRGLMAYGWDSYLLDIEPENKKSEFSESILVLTGGSDATQLGLNWPTILSQYLPSGSEVHWVTGPFSGCPIFPDSSNVEFIEHVAPAGLTALMRKAKIAVSVFGVSFFELIALGVPTVVFSPYKDRNTKELQGIAEQKIAVVAKDAKHAAELAANLLKDFELRAELSNNARNKIKNFDGAYFAEAVRTLLV